MYLTETQANVIVALADNDMNITETSRVLNFHRNTICYHVGRIKERTGKDPLKFYDLCKLLPKARAILTVIAMED